MSRIRGKNTAPELAVRSFLYHKGLRFRIHINKLPGRPDIVLPKYKTIIFVHGCFWHRHQGCKYAYIPKTRKKFWEKKFYENIKRFNEVRKILVKLGWRIIVIWECETGSIIKLRKLITVLRRKRT